ncbi:MAG: flagellar FlbD family protein [Oscillospiraceae bacterium]|jgi:flagellar protein FlbD|nr:flagellar FlbD family protein [Oscillospiraceae bacterium]
MILVTRLNKTEQYYINEDLIEYIEETPDTVISLTTDKKVVVMESAETIVERIRESKRTILQSKERVIQ